MALVLLCASVALWIRGTDGGIWHAGCSRGGALAAVAWLAYHEIHRVPAWLWPALVGLMLVLVVRPRYLWVAVPLVIALAILKPRIKRR